MDNKITVVESEKMKLETKNMSEVEIFEAGTWKGQKYTTNDIDEMVKNFKEGVAEPYITIDHSNKAISQFKDALQALALGFVDKLERKGNKLIASFKQVPKTIAELIEAGALKKKSIEFYRQFIANGKSFKNVLQGVTFHGANGLPEVNTLSDFLTLYKSNLQTMDKKTNGVVSISTDYKEDKQHMENIVELKKDEYQELLKNSSQLEMLKNEVSALTDKVKTLNEEADKITVENTKLKKEHEDFEKNKEESLKKEATDYITKKINDGVILPAHKDRYVTEYINYKADEVMFKSFTEDIDSRGKIVNLAPIVNTPGAGSTEDFKYDPEKEDFKAGATINYEEVDKRINDYMKLKKVSYEQASIDLGFTDPGELGKNEEVK